MVLAHIGARVDAVPGRRIEQRGRAIPERIEVRDGGQNIGELALDLRPLGGRRPRDRSLDLTDVLGKFGDQGVEGCFVLGHGGGSIRLN